VDDAGRNRLVRAAGLVAAAGYAGLIGWLYVQQPVTVAEVRGGLTSSVGPTNCAWRYSAAASAVALFLVEANASRISWNASTIVSSRPECDITRGSSDGWTDRSALPFYPRDEGRSTFR
jgi:hypothetical protein